MRLQDPRRERPILYLHRERVQLASCAKLASRTLLPTIYYVSETLSFTYDHRALSTRLPVRSAIFKQRTGGLVVRWVTTGESPLLYVFVSCFCLTMIVSNLLIARDNKFLEYL
ncbi:hypothetical protein HBH76_102720 [Parastagonospora nodorum]|nr:hypothetical protein HBH76_102720 [Parastagonospora nodorum]